MSISHLLWSFEGRIGRARFWFGVLLLVLMAIGLGILAALMGIPFDTHYERHVHHVREMGPAAHLFLLAAILIMTYAQLAVYAKRFHDRGKSAWWVLITFLPLIGPLWILIELGMLRGDPGPNAYGPPDESALVPA